MDQTSVTLYHIARKPLENAHIVQILYKTYIRESLYKTPHKVCGQLTMQRVYGNRDSTLLILGAFLSNSHANPRLKLKHIIESLLMHLFSANCDRHK